MSIFFTADSHFGHTNIIKYCNRPFANAKEMDETLIANWNRVVKKKDTVYHLGDFAYKFHNSYRMRLNGQIILIEGNHDRGTMNSKTKTNFTEYHKLLERTFEKKYYIVMCHYSLNSWPGQHHKSIHLYGHSHGRIPEDDYRRCCDVGVDVWNYTPVSLEAIIYKMSLKVNKGPGDENIKEVVGSDVVNRQKNQEILKQFSLTK